MSDWEEENWDEDSQDMVKGPEIRRCNENNYGMTGGNGRRGSSNRHQYSESGRKRTSQVNNYREKINVPRDCVGLIIGRGGSNIQRIQNNYNVRIDLDKRTGSASISGQNEQDVKDAFNYIENQLNSSSRNNSSIGRGKQTESLYKVEKEEMMHKNIEDMPNEVIEEIDWEALVKKSKEASARRWARLPPLTKNFYKEDYEVANLYAEDAVRIRKENNNITVSRVFKEDGISENIPNPIWKFEQCFAAYPDLLEEINKQKFTKPSPIQSQAWPILLKGEDMIGIAQTGTGKTLAFLLPAMIHTEYQSTPRSERGGPNVLVLAPTRELALQIEKEVHKYSFRGMKAVCIYGGGNRRDQINNVQSGVEIIICTPGRLNDLIEAKIIDVSSVTYLVLDEADRMLDMGFEPQIRKVMLDIRPDRQTVMTSATWPPGVRRLAQSYMTNPIQVCVGSLDLAATHTVKQIIEIMEEGDKFYAIQNFLKNMEKNDKAIIFCGKKTRADDLSSDLTIAGYICTAIHGSREQVCVFISLIYKKN